MSVGGDLWKGLVIGNLWMGGGGWSGLFISI